MKNLPIARNFKRIARAALIALIAIGCQSDLGEPSPQNEAGVMTVKDGLLKFESEQDFIKIWSEIDEGKLSIIDGKIKGLSYSSYASTYHDSLSLNGAIELLNIKALRIIANADKKFIVGENTYELNGNGISITRGGELIEQRIGLIEIFDKRSGKFVKLDNSSHSGNARSFDQIRYYSIPPVVPYAALQVEDLFLRVVISGYAKYYYRERLMTMQYSLVNAEYFKFNGGVCLCQFPNSSVAQYYYNTFGVLIYMGQSLTGYESIYGVGLSIGNSVKATCCSLFTWDASIP
ncbi:MAG TPA: hypothetical protein PKJ63_14525 [Cyclobacteriaceae bacterium]|nr:hypothetical protein [Cyclobacteriaceae bacterium]